MSSMAPTDNPRTELMRCALSPLYFVLNYVWIYDNETSDWIRFELWPEQMDALDLFHHCQLVIALKARQVGLSWLALAYGLWQMLFAPIAVVLIFSKRDDEAIYLLGPERLRGMYQRLPDWMKVASFTIDSAKTWGLSNGSVARAFPTTGGDSYTATLAIVDEADLVPDLNAMMRAIKPTIDAGGKLFLISRSDKSHPNSEFKRIYEGAKKKLNKWAAIFLPWWIRPERTQAWYDALCEEVKARTGSLDEVHEQYPATDTEALAPASLHKRLPPEWLEICFDEQIGTEAPDLEDVTGVPQIPGLMIYEPPQPGHKYVMGLDCAEGLVNSDDSVTSVVNAQTGEEVALLVGKLTPELQAAYSAQIAKWYNRAKMMPENNNHGHACVLWLKENGYESWLLAGHDKKSGWSSNTLGKVLMYDAVAEHARNQTMTIHDFRTWKQLGAIEKGTLRAPQGEGEESMDDIADAFALAQVGRKYALAASPASFQTVPQTGLYGNRRKR